MKKGFFTGRFQPFHLGHLSAIKQALKIVDFLYIGIGSTQYSHEKYHPFTIGERMEIIKKALDEKKVPNDRYKIISIPDIHDNTAWPAYVQKLVPPFDTVFVGDDGLVKELFEKHTKIPAEIVSKEINICATDIRNAIVNGGNWKKYLCSSTIKYLEKIDGLNRIKQTNPLQ
jgi:nicotinamide-nucleotide adenylyltransferase